MDAENCSWSIKAVLGTCQVSSSSILSDSKSISFIRKNGNILRGRTDMLKKIKKVIAFALALTMLMGMASIIHMIVVRLRKREVIDLIQLSGQQTSLILHVPFQRYSRLVQTNIC